VPEELVLIQPVVELDDALPLRSFDFSIVYY
jgi:hypothetical protein